MRHHRWATAAVAVGTLLFLSAASILVASEARQSQRSQSSAQTVQETAQATAQKTARVIRVADEVQADGKDALDQIAAQTRGTDNEMSREDVQRLRETLQPAAWSLMLEQANRIVTQQLVMPDFSPTTSANRSTPAS